MSENKPYYFFYVQIHTYNSVLLTCMKNIHYLKQIKKITEREFKKN